MTLTKRLDIKSQRQCFYKKDISEFQQAVRRIMQGCVISHHFFICMMIRVISVILNQMSLWWADSNAASMTPSTLDIRGLLQDCNHILSPEVMWPWSIKTSTGCGELPYIEPQRGACVTVRVTVWTCMRYRQRLKAAADTYVTFPFAHPPRLLRSFCCEGHNSLRLIRRFNTKVQHLVLIFFPSSNHCCTGIK